MGIGFGVTARVPAPDGKIMSRGTLFAAIRKAVEDSCEDPYLASLMEFGEHEHELAVVLHPGAEAIFFVWDPDGTVTADSKTSGTGPGYHAYAVDVVRAVGKLCGIEWDWSADETGYATSGNFEDLQDQMAEFLKALGAAFLKDGRMKDALPMAVNMAMFAPVPVSGGPFSITPAGPRSRSFWEAVKRGENLKQHAREFYPWWTRERDADYYRKTGLVLLWSEITWRPPADEREEATMRLAIDCFERAAELNPKLALPQAEIADLNALLNLEEGDDLPDLDPALIGYYRATIARRLPGPWTVAVPGFWPEDYNEESGVQYFGHNTIGVHVSTYDLSTVEPGQSPRTADEIAKPDKEDLPEGARPVRFRKDDRVGYYWIYYSEEEDEEGWVLQGCMAVTTSAAHITVWFAEEGSLDWAIKTFESLTHRAGHEPE